MEEACGDRWNFALSGHDHDEGEVEGGGNGCAKSLAIVPVVNWFPTWNRGGAG